MDSNNSPHLLERDQIDLFELFENLWNHKVLIALISGFFVCLGYWYTLVAPERWTAEMLVSEASPAQIDSLNPPELAVFTQPTLLDDRLMDGAKSSSSSLTVKAFNSIAPEVNGTDLMLSFTSEIRSVSTLLQFDAERAESIFQNGNQLTNEERIEAATGFLANNLQINLPSEKNARTTTITLTMGSPYDASSVLSDYVQFVDKQIVERREADLKLAISRAIQANEFEIERAGGLHIRRLEQDLALLEDALLVAQVADIKDNRSGLFVDKNDNRLTEANSAYWRGERLLKAEIQALKARISDPALSTRVRHLRDENELLRSIAIDTSTASSFSIEKPATQPKGRESPKTKRVLVLALFVGGMFGVLIALLVTAIRNQKFKKSA